MARSRFINSIYHLFERRLERERPVDPDTVGEGELGAAGGGAVGEDDGDELGGEGVEFVSGLGVEEREYLGPGRAGGSGRDQAQDDVDRERGEYQVGVLGFR